jgi:hypothetical protein
MTGERRVDEDRPVDEDEHRSERERRYSSTIACDRDESGPATSDGEQDDAEDEAKHDPPRHDLDRTAWSKRDEQ